MTDRQFGALMLQRANPVGHATLRRVPIMTHNLPSFADAGGCNACGLALTPADLQA